MENLLDYVPMTNLELETWLNARTEYMMGFPRVQEIEDMNIPIMAHTFYAVLRTGHIPTLREFAGNYIHEHGELWDSLSGPFQDGLMGRLIRTYPSLLRDLHMGIMLRDHDYHVTYNEDLDTKCGIDLLISRDGHTLGLLLYTDTPRARSYANEKKSRCYRATGYKAIAVPFKLDGALTIQGYKLYDASYVAQVDKIFEEETHGNI